MGSPEKDRPRLETFKRVRVILGNEAISAAKAKALPVAYTVEFFYVVSVGERSCQPLMLPSVHRYSHFSSVSRSLKKLDQFAELKPLKQVAEKSNEFKDKYHSVFLESRRRNLELWLKQVLQLDDTLSATSALRKFVNVGREKFPPTPQLYVFLELVKECGPKGWGFESVGFLSAIPERASADHTHWEHRGV